MIYTANKFRVNAYFLLFLISFHFFLHEPVLAFETKNAQNDHVIVQYEKSLENAAKEVLKIYPAVKLELETTFKSKIDFKPTILLIKDRKKFQKIFDSSLIVAVAISRENLIVINNSKMKTDPFTLGTTIKHELCHLFLHHFVKNGSLPRWLNEGISQWVSGGISEIITGENKDLLKQATLSRRFIRIKNLSDNFPQDEESLLLAYQESKSIVEYIDREFGPDSILQILSYLREGEEMEAAVRKGLSISIYELENRWHNYLRQKYTWFTYLVSRIYQILFSLAAVIMIYGFIKFLIKKRKYRDEEGDITD